MVANQLFERPLVARAKRIVSELTGLSESDAGKLLKAAGGSAKIAIVMARRDLTRELAVKLLARHGGMLRGALES